MNKMFLTMKLFIYLYTNFILFLFFFFFFHTLFILLTKKSRQKLNYLRKKRAVKAKYDAFFIIFKGLSVVKDCLRS